MRDIEDEIIKFFTRFIHGLKQTYKREAADGGYRAPRTERQILHRYCCDVWQLNEKTHEWATTESSPNSPKIRYPTQYPGIVVNFLRTLKEQIARSNRNNMVSSLKKLHITTGRINDALKKQLD